ncbi:MAG: hypothetical protein SF053_08535 [Bacteroidia bacterium]|nr:hypothetical protein [Bacteroidia bacterium]
MPVTIAWILVGLLYAYALAGLIFACWFVFGGVHRTDPGMKDSGWWLRLMLLPGAAALWPLLLRQYLQTP